MLPDATIRNAYNETSNIPVIIKLNKTELLNIRTGTPKCSGYGKVRSHYKVYRRLVNTCIPHVVINPSGETDGNEREKHQIKGEHDIKKEVFSS